MVPRLGVAVRSSACARRRVCPTFACTTSVISSPPNCLSAGVDVRTVAGRLGHRNAATTLNVYAHFVEQTDRAAADIMGGVLRDGA